ncbi:MAG: YceI family protein [Phycisphaera sp.]|nr:MAG: YceI family protein [Phycisphaera sp.]
MKINKILSASGLVVAGAAGAWAVSALVPGTPATYQAIQDAAITPVSFLAEPAASVSEDAKNYEIDGVHSGVVFRIMHAGAAPFYGMFHGTSGTITVDANNPAATSIDVTIDTTKVSTGNNSRDDHLRSVDFFNSGQFPTCTFKATGAESAGNGAMTVKGELTLLGKSLPVTATVTPTGEGEFRGQRAGFEAKLSFKRSDFGMTKYVEEGVLGDEVQLTVFIEGIEQ